MQEDAGRHGRPRLPVARRGQINLNAVIATVLGSAILAVAGFIYRGLDEAQDTRRQVAEQEKRMGRMEDAIERQNEVLVRIEKSLQGTGTRPASGKR